MKPSISVRKVVTSGRNGIHDTTTPNNTVVDNITDNREQTQEIPHAVGSMPRVPPKITLQSKDDRNIDVRETNSATNYTRNNDTMISSNNEYENERNHDTSRHNRYREINREHRKENMEYYDAADTRNERYPSREYHRHRDIEQYPSREQTSHYRRENSPHERYPSRERGYRYSRENEQGYYDSRYRDREREREREREKGDRERERGDREKERGDRERGDRERGDRDRDRERGDRDRERERGDREREKERGRDTKYVQDPQYHEYSRNHYHSTYSTSRDYGSHSRHHYDPTIQNQDTIKPSQYDDEYNSNRRYSNRYDNEYNKKYYDTFYNDHTMNNTSTHNNRYSDESIVPEEYKNHYRHHYSTSPHRNSREMYQYDDDNKRRYTSDHRDIYGYRQDQEYQQQNQHQNQNQHHHYKQHEEEEQQQHEEGHYNRHNNRYNRLEEKIDEDSKQNYNRKEDTTRETLSSEEQEIQRRQHILNEDISSYIRREQKKKQNDEKGEFQVFVSQQHPKVDERALFEFFSLIGRVNDVRQVRDCRTKRSKGLAFIEFAERASVEPAVALSGQQQLGHPITVQNMQVNRMKTEDNQRNQEIAEQNACTITITGLPFDVRRSDLRVIQTEFGDVDSLTLLRITINHSLSYVRFTCLEDARIAAKTLDNWPQLGRRLKTYYGIWRHPSFGPNPYRNMKEAEPVSSLPEDTILPNTTLIYDDIHPQSAEVAKDQKDDIQQVQQEEQKKQDKEQLSSSYVIIRDGFNPLECTDTEQEEIHQDMMTECKKVGTIINLYIDTKDPRGSVYIKYSSSDEASRAVQVFNNRKFEGRQLCTEFTTFEQFKMVAGTT